MNTSRIGTIADPNVRNAIESLDESTWPTELDRTQDGITTCLWHRQWEWTMAHYIPLLGHCDLCGGKVDPRLLRHNLCEARHKRGLTTPRLDNIPACGCNRCAKQTATQAAA